MRIMQLHVTSKNWFNWLSGVCIVFLTAIGILVPSDNWGLQPWKWVILALLVLAVIGFTVQLFIQSREDHDRQNSESKRDERQAGIETKLTEMTQLVSSGNVKAPSTLVVESSPVATQPMIPPVLFEAALANSSWHPSEACALSCRDEIRKRSDQRLRQRIRATAKWPSFCTSFYSDETYQDT